MWRDLVAFAEIHVGVAPRRLLGMTPVYFNALCAAHRSKIRHQEMLFAQLTAVTANFSMCHPKEPLKVQDFMLTRNRNEEPPKPKRETMAQKTEKIRAFFEAMCR